MQYLDADESVKTYSYEQTIIPYVSNVRTGRLRKYYPDFVIEYVDGKKVMAEVKPSKKVAHATVVKKLNAARDWCRDHGMTLEVITEHELKGLGLLP